MFFKEQETQFALHFIGYLFLHENYCGVYLLKFQINLKLFKYLTVVNKIKICCSARKKITELKMTK